jgi:hypothetical protein
VVVGAAQMIVCQTLLVVLVVLAAVEQVAMA